MSASSQEYDKRVRIDQVVSHEKRDAKEMKGLENHKENLCFVKIDKLQDNTGLNEMVVGDMKNAGFDSNYNKKKSATVLHTTLSRASISAAQRKLPPRTISKPISSAVRSIGRCDRRNVDIEPALVSRLICKSILLPITV